MGFDVQYAPPSPGAHTHSPEFCAAAQSYCPRAQKTSTSPARVHVHVHVRVRVHVHVRVRVHVHVRVRVRVRVHAVDGEHARELGVVDR